jgi:signal transduction histidine kinase
MVNKVNFYPEQQVKLIGSPMGLLKSVHLQPILLAALVSVYFVSLPTLYHQMGMVAGMFISIPIVGFAWVAGLRCGLLSWFGLSVVVNTVALVWLGAGSNEIFAPAEIAGQAVMLLIIVMVGRAHELTRYAAQQAEHRVKTRLTELSEINEALNIQMKQLQATLVKQEQLTAFKSRLGMMTSHEFRTPLSIIRNSSELLRNYHSQLPDEQQQTYFDMILSHVDQLTALLDDLMALGKAEMTASQKSPSFLNAEQLCHDLVSTFQKTHASTHTIRFQAEGVCKEACLDRKLMQQVVTNLMSNAIKYSPSGGEILFDLSCQEHEVIVRVQDHGVGIPREDLDHLFDLFHRGQNADIAPGTGLGLVIVKEAVEAHGGTIRVDSEQECGTTFTIRLPRLHV